MDDLKFWESSLNKRISAFNEQRVQVDGQMQQLGQAKGILDQVEEELQGEIQAYQRVKQGLVPQQATPGRIPPLRPVLEKTPQDRARIAPEPMVIRQPGPPPGQGELATEEEMEEFWTDDSVPTPKVIQEERQAAKEPIRPPPVKPEPVKGVFDAKSLMARLR